MLKLVDIIIQDAAQICNKINFDGIIGKTILITGASGLVGGYFIACLKYLSQMCNIRFTTIAVIQNEPHPYLKELLNFDNALVYRGDLTVSELCGKLPKADIIIHAAGYGQPGRFLQDQVKTLKLNTLSTFMLFDKLTENGKFLFASTSELYSGLSNPPFKEQEIGTTNTVHPRACYIEAKRCGEAICNAYRQKGIQAKSARLALAYGPGVRIGDKRVVNIFIEKAFVEKEIIMMDRGQAMRTYCYVADAVYMLWRILMEGTEPIYNVGGISRISIAELAEQIGRITKVPVRMPDSDKTGLTGAPADVSLDISKFEREFHPMVFLPIKEGLPRTVEWMRRLIESANLSDNKISTRAVHE